MTTEKTTNNTPLDPSQPLSNARYETMCELRVNDMPQHECYSKTADRRIKKKTAMVRASEIFSRPDVRARLNFLRYEAIKASQQPPAPFMQTIRDQLDGKAPLSSGDMMELARKKAEQALALAETPQDVVKAVQVCRDLGVITSGDSDDVDPTAVLRYVLSCAGKDGQTIVRELGGLRFMVDSFCDICKVSLDDLHEITRPAVKE
ncbi:MAG: hypothetical protein AB7T27_09625 [Kiritimatiellia bacterium]